MYEIRQYSFYLQEISIVIFAPRFFNQRNSCLHFKPDGHNLFYEQISSTLEIGDLNKNYTKSFQIFQNRKIKTSFRFLTVLMLVDILARPLEGSVSLEATPLVHLLREIVCLLCAPPDHRHGHH